MQNDDVPELPIDQLQAHKARIIDFLIVGVAVAIVPLSIMVSYFANKNGWGYAEITQLGTFAFIWVLALKRNLLTPRLRASAIGGFLLLAAMSEVYRYGIITGVFPLLAMLPILATVIGGFRLGLAVIGGIVSALVAIAWLTITYRFFPPVVLTDYLISVEEWVGRILNFAIAAGMGRFHNRIPFSVTSKL